MVKLEGSTFFITGGASGLGEATARIFVAVLHLLCIVNVLAWGECRIG